MKIAEFKCLQLSLLNKFSLSLLLTETFDNVTTRVHKRIEDADSIAIQCDAWSNIRNEGIINFILNTPEPVFLQNGRNQN